MRPNNGGEFIRNADIEIYLHSLGTRFMLWFLEKYVPIPLKNRKKYEFMALEQGGMNMATYEDNFHVFSRYST